MSLIEFESAREKDKKRQWEREARNAILEKTKKKYEAEQDKEEARRQRGEHKWMLPSVEAKLDHERSSKKKKKKEKKKKKKKAKKGSSASSSSESDEDGMWVEKPSSSVPCQVVKPVVDTAAESSEQRSEEISRGTSSRDGWMEMTSLFKTYSRNEIKEMDGTSRKMEKEEEKRRKQEADKPGSHALELNPYFKNGGTGLPEDEQKTKASPSSSVGLDAAWLRKALQRAKEQAKYENRSLEEIAAQRWGSLSKINELLAEAEGRLGRKDEESWQTKKNLWRERSESRSRYRRSRSRERSRSRDRKRTQSRDRRQSRSRDRQRSRSRSGGRRDRRRRRRSNSNSSSSSSKSTERRKNSRERTKHDRRISCSSSSSDSGSPGSRDQYCESYKNRSEVCKKSSSSGSSHRVVSGLLKSPQEHLPGQRSSVLSSRFHKPGEEFERGNSTHFRSKGLSSSSIRGWQKKEHLQEEEIKSREKPKQDSSSSSSSSASDTSDEEPTRTEELPKTTTTEPPSKSTLESSKVVLTDKEMNELAAKIMKAELIGNDTLASKLKNKLEVARTARANAPANINSSIEQPAVKEEVVLLTRTDAKGFSRPVSIAEAEGGKNKPGKMKTHGKDGKRLRYFPDDDKHDLKQMFEAEKTTTAEDQNSMFNRAAMHNTERLTEDYDIDDMFMSKAVMKESSAQQAERDRKRAIQEHQRSERSLESCRWCFESKEMAKHLIVALGTKAYVCLPPHESLTPGHCFIVPLHHVMCSVQADEDLWSEIQSFRKSLVKLFNSRDEDCIFFETARQLRNYPHMVINCIPLPKEMGDLAPIYFKKAIMECEAEWAQNKKLVDLKNRDVRRAVPKGLPYFFVDFAMDPGYAHVIEDERDFPHNFAQEIVGGMLDLDNNLWRKPRKENFDVQRRKVMEFSRWYKEFDITQEDNN